MCNIPYSPTNTAMYSLSVGNPSMHNDAAFVIYFSSARIV